MEAACSRERNLPAMLGGGGNDVRNEREALFVLTGAAWDADVGADTERGVTWKPRREMRTMSLTAMRTLRPIFPQMWHMRFCPSKQ